MIIPLHVRSWSKITGSAGLEWRRHRRATAVPGGIGSAGRALVPNRVRSVLHRIRRIRDHLHEVVQSRRCSHIGEGYSRCRDRAEQALLRVGAPVYIGIGHHPPRGVTHRKDPIGGDDASAVEAATGIPEHTRRRRLAHCAFPPAPRGRRRRGHLQRCDIPAHAATKIEGPNASGTLFGRSDQSLPRPIPGRPREWLRR